MMYPAHAAGGAIAGVLCLNATVPTPTFEVALLCAGLGALGGLSLDLDTPESKASQMFPPISFFTSRLFKHRGPLHTSLLVIIISAILMVLFPSSGVSSASFIAGMISHLLLDCFTVKGVQLLWPISNKSFGLRVMKSGGKLEPFMTFVLYGVLGYLLWDTGKAIDWSSSSLVVLLVFGGFIAMCLYSNPRLLKLQSPITWLKSFGKAVSKSVIQITVLCSWGVVILGIVKLFA